MFEKNIRKVWNRRTTAKRVVLHITVKTQDPDGNWHEVISEDVSESGVRLRFAKVGLAMVLGHREEVPLELLLENEETPIKAQAQLVWAYNTAQGGSISGWRFENFDGNSQRRLQTFVAENLG